MRPFKSSHAAAQGGLHEACEWRSMEMITTPAFPGGLSSAVGITISRLIAKSQHPAVGLGVVRGLLIRVECVAAAISAGIQAQTPCCHAPSLMSL